MRFEEWLRAINFSPRTRLGYVRAVKLFFDWLAENTAVSLVAEITPQHVQQYQIRLYNYERCEEGKEPRRLAVGTQMIQLAAIRKFFGWLLAEQQIAFNPAASLQMPRLPRRLPSGVLTPPEAKRLVESTPTKKPLDIRDRAILEVMYATAIRRAELISLTIYDVDLQASTLRIEHGKGDQTRIVPLTETAKTALRLYIEEARGLYAKQPGQVHLFVSSRSGGNLDDGDIVRIVAKTAKRANIKQHVTPHTLRHTCATHLLKGKADIRQIQRLLGHRRLSSTEIYTRVELSDLAEVIARCHPREKTIR